MALLSQQLQRFLLLANSGYAPAAAKSMGRNGVLTPRSKGQSCSAIAIESPSSLTEVSRVRWGWTSVQGVREEMEDDVIVRFDGLEGFSFAAVFDGHGGFSSVKFLRDELFKECAACLEGGLLLSKNDSTAIKIALLNAFVNADAKLSDRLEAMGEGDESGSTVTVVFLGAGSLWIAHVGDSSVVLSRSGKAEVLTDPHRPYGNGKASLREIRRIREAGGWVVNGRICGDIAVSRAFGDIRFKTKKDEMLKKGVEQKRWSEKFASRIKFNGDLVVASPDVYQLSLGTDAEFVVLASDGLWDFMSSTEAVDFVRNQLRQHGDVQLASEALAQGALNRRSQDNITIVIADLGRVDWQSLPPQQQQQNVFLETIDNSLGITRGDDTDDDSSKNGRSMHFNSTRLFRSDPLNSQSVFSNPDMDSILSYEKLNGAASLIGASSSSSFFGSLDLCSQQHPQSSPHALGQSQSTLRSRGPPRDGIDLLV